MNPAALHPTRTGLLLAATLLLPAVLARAQASPEALRAFTRYCDAVEARHAADPVSAPRPGEPVLEQLEAPPGTVPNGSLLHHWRATAFVPAATPDGLRQLLRDLPAYPRVFAPEVLSARVLLNTPDRQEATLRIRQKHILTVVLDTTYDIRFTPANPAGGFMRSRSLRVAEIADAGTPGERALSPGEEHGFLWAQGTFWRWTAQPGGLLVQVESVTLTRAIPTGLGWAVRPLTESIPRDELRRTLARVAEALAQAGPDRRTLKGASR